PEAQLRSAATSSVHLLQSIGKTWYQQRDCFSCHNQALPAMVFRIAQERGVSLDPALAQPFVEKSFSALKSLDRAVQASHVIDHSMDTGNFLVAAGYAGVPPTLTTGVYARLIANRQTITGKWTTIDQRPPQAHSEFTATATSLRALQLYMPPQLAAETRRRIEKARDWLRSSEPQDTEDRTYQLFGLGWAGAESGERKRAAAQLLAQQRTDGGWAQLPARESDAYATGEALVALHQAGGVPVEHPAYQRGLRFLLGAQHPDGSWLVQTRMHEQNLVSPPHFETGFPHQENQVISCMGTSWAAAALMQALPLASQEVRTLPGASSIAPVEKAPWLETALFGSAADLRALLDDKLDPNSGTAAGTTMLMMAAPDLSKVKLLIEHGASVNAKSKTRFTALMVAANYRGTTELVRYLLDKGAEANPPVPRPLFNFSPLFFAVWSGETEKVRLLQAHGADPTAAAMLLGAFPVTPFLWSVAQDDVSSVRYFVERGVDVKELDGNGISYLSEAVLANHLDMARALLDVGSNVNQIDTLGMTALMHAAMIDFGNTAMVEMLLQRGADWRLRSKDGATAIQLATKFGHHGMRKVLEQAGAKNDLAAQR
ncbi:MAG: ankyrin repeat domain-containing protein, partial [Acidobacteriota bacterium]|nr:ankyrin repeat domain-containing protein [Acidobacteriota bacterium]